MDIYLQFPNAERVFLEKIPDVGVDEVSLAASGSSELTDYFEIMGLPEVKALPPEYTQMCEHLKITGIESLRAIPEDVIKTHLKDATTALQDILGHHQNAEYLCNYLQIKEFLHGLQRARIDVQLLEQLIESSKHSVVRSTLSSFVPDSSGFASQTTYSTKGTATGRLTVRSGPQILTAPADVKSCFRSRYESGKVLQVDIVSAEPKLALHVADKKPPKDVYDHIAGSILGGKVSRSEAKQITLCALYGQSARRLAKKLPSSANTRQIIKETKKYFDSAGLESRLRAESDHGMIRNALARPLQVPGKSAHLLISYYLQSSIAEGSIIMFSKFIRETQMRAVPLFVIHDALVVDCDAESAEQLLAEVDFKLSLGEWEFDVDIKDVVDI